MSIKRITVLELEQEQPPVLDTQTYTCVLTFNDREIMRIAKSYIPHTIIVHVMDYGAFGPIDKPNDPIIFGKHKMIFELDIPLNDRTMRYRFAGIDHYP